MVTAEPGLRVAVVGAGWSGLAAAVRATALGARVTLLDTAPQAGGRARSDRHDGVWRDNGQHILIGAYAHTLALMREVGTDPEVLLLRRPLTVAYPDGSGLRLPRGPAVPAFAWGALTWRGLPWRERLAMLGLAVRWRLSGFRCAPGLTVAQLCQGVPRRLWESFLDPLTVAALNTPADEASAQVLLTVLRDALFGGPGGADLLLPRAPLQRLLPEPALAWLQARGAAWRPRHRVQRIEPPATSPSGRWRVDGEDFDRVILACPPGEAARLCADIAPAWATLAAAMRYQPIVTVWLQAPGVRWPEAMMAFQAGPQQPVQFGFDLGALGGEAGQFALVASGAGPWVERGLDATAQAAVAQMDLAFAGTDVGWPGTDGVQVLAVRAEKRATFACTPGLQRPPAAIAAGLWAAGDHVQGPYPATLEGAVRSGEQAACEALKTRAP